MVVLASSAALGALIAIAGPTMALIVPAVLVVLLVVAQPEVGVIFVAAVIPLEGATLLAGEVSVGRAIGILVAGGWVLHRLWRRQPWNRIFSGAMSKLCILFACYAAISIAWSAYPDGEFAALFQLAQLVILTLLVADLADSWRTIDAIARALLVGSFVAAILILLQYDTGLVRRAGEGITGGSANTAGRLLVTAIPFAFYLLNTTSSQVWRLLSVAYIAAAILGVAATFSRTSFLLLPLTIAFCLVRVVKSPSVLRWLAVPAAVLALSIGFIPSERLDKRIGSISEYVEHTIRPPGSGEVSSRGYHLRIAQAMFFDHPFFGAGYDSYDRGFLEYQLEVPGAEKLWLSERASHSSHAGLLADLGLTGILLWMGLFVTTLAYATATFRIMCRAPSRPERELTYALGVLIVFQLLYGFAADVHKDKILWLLFGMLIAVRRLTQERPQPTPSTPPPIDGTS